VERQKGRMVFEQRGGARKQFKQRPNKNGFLALFDTNRPDVGKHLVEADVFVEVLGLNRAPV
jgi:hypothetical protein